MRIPLLLAAFWLCGTVHAQKETRSSDKLKIFVDCSNSYCDETFFRSEVTLVDFLLDNKAADVHILVTQQGTGGGGAQYQLIFFGQNRFAPAKDTIRFTTDPNATQFEVRDQLLRHLKLGLVPFIARTAAGKNIQIDLKSVARDSADKGQAASVTTKDKWNYWVFRMGVNGFLNADAVYFSSNFSSDFSANRTTDDIKIGFEGSIGKSKSSYEFDGPTGINKISVRNQRFEVEHFLIKSISEHWSAAYSAEFERSTFENLAQKFVFKTGVEYNIFPYKQVNTKFFAVRYLLDAGRNKYFDTTLYEKLDETLFGHGLETQLSVNQKWGTTSLGVEYHNYFRKGNFFNLGANAQVDVRITGGLSFNVYAFGELVRDQLSLPKEDATGEEVLTRRRQIASGYNYYLSFGLNYRFGSKLNNFVNPRFN